MPKSFAAQLWDQAASPDVLGVLSYLTGLAGPPANESLFFLRDLFVAVCIAVTAAPIARRAPALLIALAFAIAITDALEPVLFRPAILLFVIAGLCARMHGVTLQRLSHPAIAIPAALFLGAAALFGEALCAWEPPVLWAQSEIFAATLNILRRGALVFAVLAGTASIAGSRFAAWVKGFEPAMYLTYLAHATIMAALWRVWLALTGGGSMDPSYVLFFLGAPVAALCIGRGLGWLVGQCPPWVQKLLHGKVRAASPVNGIPVHRG